LLLLSVHFDMHYICITKPLLIRQSASSRTASASQVMSTLTAALCGSSAALVCHTDVEQSLLDLFTVICTAGALVVLPALSHTTCALRLTPQGAGTSLLQLCSSYRTDRQHTITPLPQHTFTTAAAAAAAV
jgi:5-formyltetrahydrofolate cyclo-ligase